MGEVPFAGHPTLGTAYVIYKYLEKEQCCEIKLNLKAGIIPVRVEDNRLIMKQNQPEFGITINKNIIADIYGIEADEIRDDFPIEWVSTGLEAVVVPLKERNCLKKLVCNREKFKKYILRYPMCNCNHLFFVDTGNNTFAARCLMEDFVEEAATGSANGGLAGYFMKHNYFHSDEVSYKVIQGEDMGRKSVLQIHTEKKGKQYIIEVGGSVCIVASGNWE